MSLRACVSTWQISLQTTYGSTILSFVLLKKEKKKEKKKNGLWKIGCKPLHNFAISCRTFPWSIHQRRYLLTWINVLLIGQGSVQAPCFVSNKPELRRHDLAHLHQIPPPKTSLKPPDRRPGDCKAHTSGFTPLRQQWESVASPLSVESSDQRH